MADHLECEHGGKVVGASHHLADRQALAADLDEMPDADVLLVGLKAAAVDLAVPAARERGMEVVFCDNRVVPIGGDGTSEELARATAGVASRRFTSDEKEQPGG